MSFVEARRLAVFHGCFSLAIVLMSFVTQAPAQTDVACSQREGFATDKWREAKPAHLPIEIMIANTVGWMGINHTYMSGEFTKRSFRSFVPWVNPQYIQAYPYSHAVEALTNRSPVFYLHFSDPLIDANIVVSKISLSRMKVVSDRRELRVTTGFFTWNAKRSTVQRADTAIEIKLLRDDFAEITVPTPLENGEYLILLSSAGGEGFEFRVDCK